MIQATILEEKEDEEKMYPYIGKNDRTIVLFFEEDSGICLVSSTADCVIGVIYNDWVEDQFKIFHGKVEIFN